VYDGLGSAVGEVAPDGTLTRSQSFDVYGCVRTSSGTATTKHKFVAALGHPSDDETGLIYMRARHYDPVCGRFASEDPSYHGRNWYVYCGDNPGNAVDSTGKSLEWVNHVFGDDQFGLDAMNALREALANGDIAEFGEWMMENFRGNMSLAFGTAATVVGRFRLLLLVHDLELAALSTAESEIGTGAYLSVESIDSLIVGAEGAEITDMETGVSVGTLNGTLGGL
jgi:RHS repeat-associated protein